MQSFCLDMNELRNEEFRRDEERISSPSQVSLSPKMAELIQTPYAPGAFPATPDAAAQAGDESANSSSSYFPVNTGHLAASTLLGLVIGGPAGALALGGLSLAESNEAAALSEKQVTSPTSPIANEIGGATVPASLLATASGGFREDAESLSPFPIDVDPAVGVPTKASQLPVSLPSFLLCHR